jgi:deazaflavin-dependent oxidoreductase (nitroreductase family)
VDGRSERTGLEATMTDENDGNRRIIEEFRASGGKVGGFFEGQSLLLLHHRGAKSGVERVNPLVYLQDGSSLVVFGTNAGGLTDPHWVHNLAAHPDAAIEVGSEQLRAEARLANPDERTRLWELAKAAYPHFGDYELTAGRAIPVVILDPA